MIISASREFIFIHLQKCGGTSVESALQPHLHWSDMILGSTDFGEAYQSLLHDRYGVDEVRRYMLWKHSTAEDIHAFLGPDEWKRYKKIAVVREPTQLVQSLYSYSTTVAKYHLGRINKQVWLERIRTNSFPKEWPYTEDFIRAYALSVIERSGIDGFVRSVLKSDQNFILPQYERLSVMGCMETDLVIDLATLEDRWQEVVDYCGIEDPVPLGRLNASEPEHTELSQKSIRMIKQHFAIDYQQLPRYTNTSW